LSRRLHTPPSPATHAAVETTGRTGGCVGLRPHRSYVSNFDQGRSLPSISLRSEVPNVLGDPVQHLGLAGQVSVRISRGRLGKEQAEKGEQEPGHGTFSFRGSLPPQPAPPASRGSNRPSWISVFRGGHSMVARGCRPWPCRCGSGCWGRSGRAARPPFRGTIATLLDPTRHYRPIAEVPGKLGNWHRAE
jgi:hypothetical protein